LDFVGNFGRKIWTRGTLVGGLGAQDLSH